MAKTPTKSVKSLTKTLEETVKKAKGLGVTSPGLNNEIARSESMIAQTKKEKGKEYAGSSFENSYLKSDAYKKSLMGTPMITSQQGKSIVQQADSKINNLSPIDQPTTPPSQGTAIAPATQTGTTTPTTPPETSNDYITYVNQNTGQEMTLRGSAITEEAKANALKNGYTEASSEISGIKTTPEMAQLQSQVDSATRETDSFMTKLESMIITDKELRGELRTIGAKYKARQSEMEEINKRREVAMTTLGIRTGMRYTGGTGGVMGSILSEEERQGLMRIEQIENDKQEAILGAKKAARDQNFQLYAKLADKAEKTQEAKVKELQTLKKAQAEQDAKIAEESRKSLVGAVVSDLINKGVTSNNEIYAKLTDPTISAVIGNVAPEDFKKLMDALLPTGTGIIGEYEYYKREAQRAGQTPLSFDDYQTRDANRKRPVTNISMGSGNVPNQVVTQVDKLSSSFDSSPIVKTYNEVQNKKLSMDAILASGIKGPGDLAIVFEFMKALDPTSVVREQEYANASQSGNIFAGAMARFNGYFDPNGGFLPQNVKNDFQNIINQKLNVADSQYQNLRNETARKIEMKTKQYDPNTPGTDYLTDYGGASTGQTILQDEAKAEAKITQIYGQYGPQIDSLLNQDPSLSNSDVLQILGIQL